MTRITSRRNAIVRFVRDLARRRESGDTTVVLDGAHLVEAAIAEGIPLRLAAATDAAATAVEGRRLLREAAAAGAEVVTVTREVLDAMSPTTTPSGLLAVATVTPASLEAALDRGPALILAAVDVQDAGNLGALVRAADASGATAVICCGACADPFGWKALRGSMGSAFRLPIVPRAALRDLIDACRRRGLRTWATTPRGGVSLFEADLVAPCCVLFGGEGDGLDSEALAAAESGLTVPMRPGVESLNVAVAAALVGYEAFRQRAGLLGAAWGGSRLRTGGGHGRA